MKIWRSIKESLSSLKANKTRSFLTILGIIIGVASVIAMIAIGKGAQGSITGEIESMGTNIIYIAPSYSEEITNPRPLTTMDAAAISTLQGVDEVLPVVYINAELAAGKASKIIGVQGVMPEQRVVENYKMQEGSGISATHIKQRLSVVVLAPKLADALFGSHVGVVGNTVRINGFPFKVIGVTQAKGGQSADADMNAWVPLTTAQSRLSAQGSTREVHMLVVKAVDAAGVKQIVAQIPVILRNTHNLSQRAKDDFQIINQQDYLKAAEKITGIVTTVLAGVAGISLLVGGIGIMNIMLVTVTERTREIGLRKALGARRRDILVQFLTESAILSLLGGFIGIGLAWGITLLVGVLSARSGTPFTPQISPDAVLIATLFSAVVGIFFGLYPASRASKLAPVEALRYE